MITSPSTYRALGREAAAALNAKSGIGFAQASARFRALREQEPTAERELATLEFETGIRSVTRADSFLNTHED